MKHRKPARAAAALLCLLLIPVGAVGAAGSVCGSPVDGYETVLAGGAALTETTYWNGNDLQTEHYVTAMPSDKLSVTALSGDTLCSVGSAEVWEKRLAENGQTTVALVNGGFFTMSTKEPVGLVVSDGVLRADGEGICAVGFTRSGEVVFGNPAIRMRLVMDNAELAIDALNKGFAEGTVLYSADFFEGKVIEGCNVLCRADGELPVSGSVTLTVTAQTGDAVKVPAGQLLLHHADPDAAILSALQPGDTLTLEIECADGWENVDSGLGILYKLVSDGKVEEHLDKATAAPRSAIGVKSDGTVILYTVDGRQSGYSVGLTLQALAERMKELGCVEAGCLDGGGSTNLCAVYPGDSKLSPCGKPSGGVERNVATCIAITVEKTRAGSASQLALYPLHINAMVGASQMLTVRATDKNGAAAAAPTGVSYSVSGGIGRVQNGVFYAEHAGSGTITVSAAGLKSASIPAKVVAAPDEFALYGEVYGRLTSSLTLEPEQEVDLTVRAKANHISILTSDEGFVWTLDPAVGTVDSTGHITPAENSGSGSLTVSAAGKSVTIPITIRAALPFYDVKKSDGWYEAVKFAYDNGILVGTGDTTFEPETVMDRAMLVTILWRLSGEPAAEQLPTFSDVAAESWYGPAVAWAAENGIVAGYSETQFAPTDALTKEQILTILQRWSGESTPEGALLNASDAAAVGDWAVGALIWATAEGQRLVDPDETGALLPKAPMTRAAVADVMMRYLTR